MAPKRKHTDVEGSAEAVSSSTRVTRSTAAGRKTPSKNATARKADVAEDDELDEPVPKKTRARSTQAKSKAPKETKTKGSRVTPSNAHDVSEKTTTTSKLDDDRVICKDVEMTHSETGVFQDQYIPQSALSLFNNYKDLDADGTIIGPEGLERLCKDANIPLDGAQPLILGWLLNAKELGKFSQAEWLEGMDELQIGSLSGLSLVLQEINDLLILGKVPTRPQRITSTRAPSGKNSGRASVAGQNLEPVWKARYYEYAADRKKAFNKLYMFCFTFAKPPQSKNIDMETATAMWSVLLAPNYSLMQDVIAFITDKGIYRGVNKDLWNMMAEFCQVVSSTLENYEIDGAWPTLLDDFVTWKKSQSGLPNDGITGPTDADADNS